MKEVGETLKRKREELNLSLKEVENATSIRMSYLQAIEDGDGTRLISPVYAQGFVKQYAIYLGLDGEQLVQQHPEIFNKPENQHFDYGIGTLEKRGSPGAAVSSMPNAVWGALFIGLLLTAWVLARYLDLL
jgi:cytoskeletal protein RodZ